MYPVCGFIWFNKIKSIVENYLRFHGHVSMFLTVVYVAVTITTARTVCTILFNYFNHFKICFLSRKLYIYEIIR